MKIRDLFSAREKELALAVAKVNNLTQQLEEQRKGWGQDFSPAPAKTEQEVELERLRKELMVSAVSWCLNNWFGVELAVFRYGCIFYHLTICHINS